MIDEKEIKKLSVSELSHFYNLIKSELNQKGWNICICGRPIPSESKYFCSEYCKNSHK